MAQGVTRHPIAAACLRLSYPVLCVNLSIKGKWKPDHLFFVGYPVYRKLAFWLAHHFVSLPTRCSRKKKKQWDFGFARHSTPKEKPDTSIPRHNPSIHRPGRPIPRPDPSIFRGDPSIPDLTCQSPDQTYQSPNFLGLTLQTFRDGRLKPQTWLSMPAQTCSPRTTVRPAHSRGMPGA